MTRSIEEGFLFGSKFVGSEISRERLSELRRFSIFLPSGVVSPSGHQNWECPLKSPVKNDAYGFSFLILEYKLVKFDRKSKNAREV